MDGHGMLCTDAGHADVVWDRAAHSVVDIDDLFFGLAGFSRKQKTA